MNLVFTNSSIFKSVTVHNGRGPAYQAEAGAQLYSDEAAAYIE